MSGEQEREEREVEREEMREAARAAREAEREQRRREREQARAERHRARKERREQRHMGPQFHFEMHGPGGLGHTIGEHIGREVGESIRRGMKGFAFNFGDRPEGDAETSEVVEKRLAVEGLPRIRVRNVSGETTIAVGKPGEVSVHAKKRVRGWSEDRAKRVLENVEVRIEQRGDDIIVEPRVYEQDRGWAELFRGGRAAVDFDIEVPREVQLELSTVSGDVSVTGTRGPLEIRGVSGDIELEDIQGPMRIKTVSGDIRVERFAGAVETNSVSGEVRFERSRLRAPDIVTVSGEVDIEGSVSGGDGSGDGRVKTVSGEVELALVDPAISIEFRTLSGDVDVDAVGARVDKESRRQWHVTFGEGGPRLWVKTVSGGLSVRRSGEAVPSAEPTAPPAPPSPEAPAGPDVRDLLERVARGEMTVDEASAALDEARR